MNKWYEKVGNQGDVVLSTRIRLARNLKQYPFPNRMNDEQKQSVIKEVCQTVLNANSSENSVFEQLDMSNLSRVEMVSLVEKHLVSPEFISRRNGRALLLMKDESASVMINEEDHVRVQVIRSGLDFESAFEEAILVDKLLEEKLEIAFNEKLGYLTQCPTNLGTGMRASLMLHLPALEESGVIQRLLAGLTKIGLALRGFYGEGTQAKGAIYQLSNQITLGISEKCAIKNLNDIAMQLIAQEREARKVMCERIDVQDKILRSYGILKYSKSLTNEEFMKYISYVKMGISQGIIEDDLLEKINNLIVQVQPATLSKNIGQDITQQQSDIHRSEIVKKYLS